MFRGFLSQFEDDPFFSDPLQRHHEQIRQMTRGLGHNQSSATEDQGHGGRRGQSCPAQAPQQEQEIDFFDPFCMFTDMKKRMEDVQRHMESMTSEPSTHSFSSSSFIKYTKKGDEAPKVFQASAETSSAPGGVKEVRKCVRDTETGLEKMSIGHHIKDRGHVVEKKGNRKTGQQELMQDFQNLDETEAQAFDQEWHREVSRFQKPQLQVPRRDEKRGKVTSAPHKQGKTHHAELNIKARAKKH